VVRVRIIFQNFCEIGKGKSHKVYQNFGALFYQANPVRLMPFTEFPKYEFWYFGNLTKFKFSVNFS